MRLPKKLRKVFTLGLPITSRRGNWASRSSGLCEAETPLLTRQTTMPGTTAEMSVSSHRPGFQSDCDALEGMKKALAAINREARFWKVPYEWDPPDHPKNNRWAKAFLYEPKEKLRKHMMIGADKSERFSHPVEEIPLIQTAIQLHNSHSEAALKYHLYLSFQRMKQLELERKEINQDLLIIDFIFLLGTITEVNQRSKSRVQVISRNIQAYLMETLPEFEKKLTASNRSDIQALIDTLKELWNEREHHN